MTTVKREIVNYSENPTFSVIMTELGWLAGTWRETKDKEYVKQYHILFRALKEMGCEDELDIELMLPLELMPKEYFED